MKRYLVTSDSCPPCKVLHEEDEEILEQSGAEEIDPTKKEGFQKFSELVEKADSDIAGIPALIEEDDDKTNVSVGLKEVKKRLKEITGE